MMKNSLLLSYIVIPAKAGISSIIGLVRAKKKWFSVIAGIMLSACSNEPNIPGNHLVKIEAQSTSDKLFYTGTIKPIKTLVIPSPADGVVVEMPVQYGEVVKPGQLLFLISSAKFLSDYKSALLQYIKAKSDLNNSQTQLSESEFLHKNLLISDDDFKSKQSNFYTSRLALMQAKDALDILLKQLDIKNVNIDQISIADIEKINDAMHLQKASDNLRILSPVSGVLLSPIKGEEETKKLIKGDVVKQGDVLAIIGDMNGLSVHIKVNELTINQIKTGQKVEITGIAFPTEILKGRIERVDRQGDINNGLPSFGVEIVIPTLTKPQQEQIHVGMSAKIEINLNDEKKILVPIAAIKENAGMTYARVYDETSGKINEVLVKTGKTNIDSVTILSGLKAGDQIVVPD